jgi:hypothetical protein
VGAILILVGSGVAALVFTAWLGSNHRRVLAIAAFGVGAVSVLVAVSLATAPTSVEESTCHHCAEYLGRWVDPLALIFPAVLGAAWLIGVVIGAAAGAARRR